LKKIINSYAAGRSAADASLLSLGLRPPKRPLGPTSSDSPSYSEHDAAAGSGNLDLDPLPPTTEPPAPKGIMSEGRRGRNAKEDSFKAHRDVFFFTLQRELEKVCLVFFSWSKSIANQLRSTHSTSSKNAIYDYDF
jgi:CDK inhibitor PHO81